MNSFLDLYNSSSVFEKFLNTCIQSAPSFNDTVGSRLLNSHQICKLTNSPLKPLFDFFNKYTLSDHSFSTSALALPSKITSASSKIELLTDEISFSAAPSLTKLFEEKKCNPKEIPNFPSPVSASHTVKSSLLEFFKTTFEYILDPSKWMIEQEEQRERIANFSKELNKLDNTIRLLIQLNPDFDPQDIIKRSSWHCNALKNSLNLIKEKSNYSPQVFFNSFVIELIKLKQNIGQVEEIIPFLQLTSLYDSFEFPVTERLLAHVLGNSFSRHSSLEGELPIQMLEYRMSFLHEKLKSLKNDLSIYENHQQEIKQEIESIRKIYKLLLNASEMYKAFEGDVTEFQKKFSFMLGELKIGEELFFQVSWPGHSIILEFTNEGEDAFSLKVYNLGEALQYQPSVVASDSALKFLPFFELINIRKENILNLVFLKSLQELEFDQLKREVPIDFPDFYHTIIPQLKGEVSTRSYPLSKIQNTQTSGICAYYSLDAYIKDKLDNQNKAYFHTFELQLKTLLDFYKQNLHHFKNPFIRNLTKKALISFSSNLKWLHEQKVIDDWQLEYAVIKTEEIEEDLRHFDKLGSKNSNQNIFSVPETVPLSSTFDGRLAETKLGKSPPPAPFPADNWASWQPKIETVNTDLQAFLADISSLVKEKEFSHALIRIERLIASIPLNDGTFWNKLKPAEAEPLIESLASLSKRLVQVLLEDRRKDPRRLLLLKGEEYLAQLKLLTVADLLARLHAKHLRIEIPYLHQKKFNNILNSESSAFKILNPQWEIEFVKIADYWNHLPFNRKSGNEFFEFNVYPAGVVPYNDRYYKASKLIKKKLKEYQRDQKWSDIEWVKDLIKEPYFKEKIINLHPELDNKHEVEKTINLLCNRSDVLPPTFYNLRDLSFLTDFLLTGSFSSFTEKQHTLDFDKGVVQVCKEDGDKFLLTYQLFDVNANAKNVKEKTQEHNFGFYDGVSVYPDEHFKHVLNLFSGHDFEHIYNEKTQLNALQTLRKRIEPNKIVSRSLIEGINHLTLQEVRELLYLSASKAEQAFETLAYFKKKRALFQDKRYRQLFSALMFEPGILSHKLTKKAEETVQFCEQIGEFCKSGYDFYRKIQSEEGMLFFLELSRKFSSYIDAYKKNFNPQLPSTPYVDIKKELTQFLQIPQLSNQSKIKALKELALNYANHNILNSNELVDLIHALARLYLLSSNEKEPIDLEFDRYSLHISELIRTSLSMQDKDNILNRVYQKLVNSSVSFKWKENPTFPYYMTESEKISLDLVTGKLYSIENKLNELPSDVIEDPVFLEIFKGIETTAKTADGHTFELETMNKIPYQILYKEDNPLIFKRFWKGDWYELKDRKELSFEPQYVLDRYRSYYSEKTKNLILMDPETQLIRYRVEMGAEGKIVIHYLDSEENDTGLVIGNISSQQSNFRILEKFECPSHTILLVDFKTGIPVRLLMPRYGLEFVFKKFENQLFAYSTQYPKYRLAQVQEMPLLGNIPLYLILEREPSLGEKKETLILISKQDFNIQKNSLLNDILPAWESSGLAEQTFYPYEWDPDKSALIPNSPEGRLYLSLIYLWRHDYEGALHHLVGTGGQIAAFSAEEEKILFSILNLYQKNNDLHPKAIAVRFKSLAMLLRNERDFTDKLSQEINLKDLIPIVQNYYKHNNELKDVKLDTEEELLILNYFSDKIHNPEFVLSVIKNIEDNQLNPPVELPAAPFVNKEKKYPYFFNVRYIKPKDYSPALLRANLKTNFVQKCNDCYSAKSLDTTQLKALIFEISGIRIQDELETDALFKILHDSLHVIKQSYDREQALLAHVLQTILLHPNDKKTFIESLSLEKDIDSFEHLFAYDSSNNLQLETPPSRILIDSFGNSKITTLPVDSTNFQICPALQDSFFSFPNLEFNLKTSVPQVYSESQEVPIFDQINDALNIHLQNSVADRALRELLALVNKFSATVTAPISYQVPLLDEIKRFRIKCEKLHATYRDTTLKLTESIEKLANHITPNSKEKALRSAKYMCGQDKPIKINELINLFLKRDAHLYFQRNPHLSVEDILTLNQEILKFLELKTTAHHLERLFLAAGKIERGMKENQPQDEIDQLLQQFAAIYQARRAYSVKEHPEYLVFEYYMGILLHPDQIANLEKLQIVEGKIRSPHHVGAVLEMIMGAGKTSVIMPLLNFLYADGENLSLIVMPENLVPSMAAKLQQTLGESFKQILEVVSFNRQAKFNLKKLNNLHIRLQKAIKGRKSILISNQSIHSLYLKFIEKLSTYAKQPFIELEKEINVFRKILSIFKENGYTLIDEIHDVFDVLKSSHYAVGTPEKIDSIYTRTISQFYLFLAKNPIINQLIKFKFLPSHSSSLFTSEKYEEMKPHIVQCLLSESFSSFDSSELREFFSELNAQEKKYIEKFLLNQIDARVESFIDGLSNEKIQDILALLKEEINTLLPLTAKKNFLEHYGFNPEKNSQSRFAIPWNKGKPNLNSQFGTDMEILNYTIQQYLENGVTLEIVNDELNHLFKQINDELEKNDSLKLEETKGYQEFLKLTGGKGYSPFKLIESEREEIVRFINQSVDLKMALIERHVLTNLEINKIQLNADSQSYGIFFKLIQGLTGTPWNRETYSKAIQTIHLSDTDAKTLYVLFKDSPKKVFNLDKFSTSECSKAIQTLYSQDQIPKGSFIDLGGVFKGIPNAKIAEEILTLDHWKQTPVRGVVFYDEQNQLSVLSFKDKKPHTELLSSSPLQKDELIAFWDQPHTQGSDIKLSSQMTAVVSVNSQTQLFELFQAVWRLRGLGKGQKVSFMVLKEEEEIIRNALEKTIGDRIEGPLTLKHMILYTLFNQSFRLGSENFVSFQQKLQALLAEKVFSTILDPAVALKEVGNIYQATSRLFETERVSRPYLLYGKALVQEPREIVAEKVLNNTYNSPAMKAFITLPTLKERYGEIQLRNELADLKKQEVRKLPDTLFYIQNYNKERNVQTETEVEVLQEKQMETKRSYPYESYSDPIPKISWKNINLFQKQSYNPKPATEIKNLFIAKIEKGIIPLLTRFGNALGSFKKFEEYHSSFDKNLLCSLNLCPIFGMPFNVMTYDPFGIHQKDFSQALVIEDIESGEISLMLADQNDVKDLSEKLLEDAKHPMKGEREVRAALYHLDLGMNVQGHDRIDPIKLEANPHFQRLKTQAKFIRGEIMFSNSELHNLKEWIKKDKQELIALFKNEILKWKEVNQKSLLRSRLGELIEASAR